MIGKYKRKFVKMKGYEMKKRMKMAAAVMAAGVGMVTPGGCGRASEKSETAVQAEGRMRNRPRKMKKSGS